MATGRRLKPELCHPSQEAIGSDVFMTPGSRFETKELETFLNPPQQRRQLRQIHHKGVQRHIFVCFAAVLITKLQNEK